MDDYTQPILVVTSENQLKISPISFVVSYWFFSKSQLAEAWMIVRSAT